MESEEFLEILDYLPIYFLTEENKEFIEYLKNIFIENWKEIRDNGGNKICELNQVSFKAYYDLYIIFIFVKIWQIKKNNRNSFERYFNNFSKEIRNKIGAYSNPFHISPANEKEIFNFLRIFNFSSNWIDKFSSFVKIRDHCSHPCGEVEYKKDDLVKEMSKMLEYCKKINNNDMCRVGREKCFTCFLENFDYEQIDEYLVWAGKGDANMIQKYMDLIQERFEEDLIRKNYFSRKDVKFLVDFDIDKLKDNKDFGKIEVLFNLFKQYFVGI